MEYFNSFLEWGAITLTILSVVVTAVVAVVLIRHKDAKYKKRYEDFQRQKKRVEANLDKARQSQTGG